MRANGKMICKRGSAKNAGLMEVSMKEGLIRVSNMELEDKGGQTDQYLLDSGSITKYMEL